MFLTMFEATGMIWVTMNRKTGITISSEQTAQNAAGRGFFLILNRPRKVITGLQSKDTTAARMTYTSTFLRYQHNARTTVKEAA